MQKGGEARLSTDRDDTRNPKGGPLERGPLYRSPPSSPPPFGYIPLVNYFLFLMSAAPFFFPLLPLAGATEASFLGAPWDVGGGPLSMA